MPWEKRFDEEEILDKAMELFWQRGYQAVSMSDLVEELGVNRSSLYATYGQKEDLFLKALLRYDRVHREEWFAGLSARFGPVESIRQAFVEVAEAPKRSRRFGCLLVNTTLDLPSAHSKLAVVVQEAFEATERFFEHQLDLAQRDGDLPENVDIPALAATLMALFLGLRVLARARRSVTATEPILRQVDSMLDAESGPTPTHIE